MLKLFVIEIIVYPIIFFSKVNMSDKVAMKSYEYRQCHKMTIGYPALYRQKCLEC